MREQNLAYEESLRIDEAKVLSFPFKLVLQYQAAEEALKADHQLVR